MMSRKLTSFLVVSVLAVGCSKAQQQPPPAPPPPAPMAALPQPTAAPATPAADTPPPPGIAPDWTFPKIADQTANNGLLVRVVERHALPVVELELVIQAGSASDGDKPGIAAVAGELLKAGGAGKWTSRALLDAAEALGSSLDVLTDRDSTRITMAVTKDHVGEALDLLAAVAVKPRFDAAEFQKLKRREMDRVSSLSRTSAGWVANMVLYRELFQLPTGVHPYSRFDAMPKQIEALKLEDCRAWHKREVTPKNAFIVIAGDVEQKSAGQEVERAFAGWTGERAEGPAMTAPMPPNGMSIYLVDRPSSPQAEVYVATLGVERQSPEWPVIRTANQILGGGVAGRLFLDVREKRSLAYRTRSSIDALAHGPSPIILSAGTQTAKAGMALDALLTHFQGMGKTTPTEPETAIATRYLSDVFLVGVDTVAAIANMTTDLGVFGLPPDYYDTYRAAVRNVTKDAVAALAAQYFQPGRAVVVVAGDAARLAKPLSHFGPVHVVDAESFVTRTNLPLDPTAPIELERINGT